MKVYRPQTIDPSRLRYNVSFYKQQSIKTASGGSPVTTTLVLTTKAAKSDLRGAVEDYPGRNVDQELVDAGTSILNEAVYFTIRARASFYPDKTMQIFVEGDWYEIRSIIPLNEPVTYIKLLAVKTNHPVTPIT